MHFLKQHDGRAALNMCTCGKVHFSYGSITFHSRPTSFLLSSAPLIQEHAHEGI